MSQDALTDRTKLRVFWVAMLSIPLVSLLLVYSAAILARGGWSYYQFEVREHSWAGQAWRASATLGYAHTPGFRGRQSLRPGLSQALVVDEHGFRVPAAGRPAGRGGPKILSLGGSFTFGVGVEARETYTEVVARELGGTAYNAGVSGYGLSQMVLQSRHMMRDVEPDVVLAAYAPWLVQRASSYYSTTRFAAVPVPYMAGEPSAVVIEPPAFRPIVFDLGLADYFRQPAGVVAFLSYAAHVALPLYLHDDSERLLLRLKAAAGHIPRPLSDRAAIVRAAYGEIADHARAAGARLYILDITSFYPPTREDLDALAGVRGAEFVATREALWSHVDGTRSEDYLKVFAHWAGDPPVMVDLHPNARAHGILASQVLRAMGHEAGSG